MDYLFIHLFFWDDTLFHCHFQRIRHKVFIKIVRHRHFNIQFRSRCQLRVMNTSPVRYHYPVISPFFPQNVLQKIPALAAVFPINFVISPHDREASSPDEALVKSRKIDFPECLFIYLHIHPESLRFLIVCRKMLHTGCHIPLLYPLDKGHCQFSGEIRILTEIFKIPAAQRTSLDVNTRGQNHILAPSSAFFPQNTSHGRRKFPVPCGRQGTITGKVGNIIIRIADCFPMIRLKFLPYPHRPVRHD